MTITIITVTFNSAKTVKDTIESVLNQDWKDYEYVIVDNCSTDGTVDIIREYEPKFEGRMKWISEPDAGLYDAMNKGIARATGEVVGILNSDDFYSDTDVLSTIADEFDCRGDGLDAVYADLKYVKRNDKTKVIRYYSCRRFSRFMMHFGFMPAHPTFYCRRSVYERFRLDGQKIEGFTGDVDHIYFNPKYKIVADFESNLRMIYNGRIRTQYIAKDFVTMRKNGVSSSGIACHIRINREKLQSLKENNVYSNWLLISLRYCYKIAELAAGRMRRI